VSNGSARWPARHLRENLEKDAAHQLVVLAEVAAGNEQSILDFSLDVMVRYAMKAVIRAYTHESITQHQRPARIRCATCADSAGVQAGREVKPVEVHTVEHTHIQGGRIIVAVAVFADEAAM
jgi:hypothetical protein